MVQVAPVHVDRQLQTPGLEHQPPLKQPDGHTAGIKGIVENEVDDEKHEILTCSAACASPSGWTTAGSWTRACATIGTDR